jgi:hypothetical protein
MSELYQIFGWGSPVGTGLFLALLGLFIFLITLAGKNNKK